MRLNLNPRVMLGDAGSREAIEQFKLLAKSLVAVAALSQVLSATSPLVAQEKSVRPGLNKSFEEGKVDEFVGRFEKEGRDVFDRRHEVIEALALRPGMVVADIGAGTGLYSRMFAQKVGEKGLVLAVDITEKFVKHVDDTARAQGVKNVKGVLCKPDSAELPDNSVDLAFICDTYHHFEFPEKTMRSIHKALKPGGQVVLIDFHRIEGKSTDWVLGHVRAGQEVFSREIVAAGFKQVDEKKDLLKESYFVRFEKVEP